MRYIFTYFERLIQPVAEYTPEPVPQNFIQFVLFFLKQNPILYLFGLLTLVILAFLDLLVPWSIGYLVDAFDSSDPTQINEIPVYEIVILVGLLCLKPFVIVIDALIRRQAIFPGSTNRVRWQLFLHVLFHNLAYFRKELPGRISDKIVRCGSSFRELVYIGMELVAYFGAFTIIAIGFFLSTNIILAVVFCIWAVLLGGVAVFLMPRVQAVSQGVAQTRTTLTGELTDTFSNMESVKVFNRNQNEEMHIAQILNMQHDAIHQEQRIFSLLNITNAFFGSALFIANFLICLWLMRHQKISVGEMTAILALTLQISSMIQTIIFRAAEFSEAIGTVRNTSHGLTENWKVPDIDKPKNMPEMQGKLSLEKIHFHYEGGENSALADINLEIESGEHIAFVGASGSGKSTLIRLLARHEDIQQGKVKLDDVDISHVKQVELRSKMGFLPQDSTLFNRSVEENIRYGNPDISEIDLIKACRAAHIYDEIQELIDPDGNKAFQYRVGDQGRRLSGGQRQRILLARLLLRKSNLIILDEITSALDPETTEVIGKNLTDYLKGKTVINVSHNLRQVAHYDKIIVLEKGRIKESGKHHELIEKKGAYWSLWCAQNQHKPQQGAA